MARGSNKIEYEVVEGWDHRGDHAVAIRRIGSFLPSRFKRESGGDAAPRGRTFVAQPGPRGRDLLRRTGASSLPSRGIDAVERCLERICEASFRLGDTAPALMPKQPWQEIRGMGNRLRHGYHRIRVDVIWRTVVNRLPSLKTDAQRALAELGPRGAKPRRGGAG